MREVESLECCRGDWELTITEKGGKAWKKEKEARHGKKRIYKGIR